MQTPLDAWTNTLNVRNRLWDNIFYDVDSVKDDMNTLFPRGILSPFAYGEGEIIVVPQRGREDPLLQTHCAVLE